ncbi:MAG: hypothetical protein J6T10_29830 [Methanobrevibacter sp.]|nr:hypothetical protein [Methanobrevibacter sp.]
MKLDKNTLYLVKTVTDTMGPNGKLTILDYKAEALTTKDGYNTAYNIPNPTPIFKLLRQASKQQAQTEGDGTTGVISLATEMVKRCHFKDLKELESVCNDVKDMLDVDKEELDQFNCYSNSNYLSDDPLKVRKTNLFNVSMIVTNGDERVAKPISEAIFHNGPTGHYIVEETQEPDITYEQITGFYLPIGYGDPFFINQTNGSVVFDHPEFVIKDQITMSELAVPASKAAQEHKPLVIIGSISEDTLNVIKTNQLKGVGNYLWINTAFIPAQHKADIFVDLEKLASTITKVETRSNNTIFQFKEDKALKSHIKMLKSDAKLNRERIARFESKICKIKVGANSAAELKQIKDSVEDCILSTISAYKNGVVTGAGYALKKAFREASKNYSFFKKLKYRKIFETNYNKIGVKYIDPVKVIDSAGVIKSQVTIAFDVAKTILSSEHIVTPKEGK